MPDSLKSILQRLQIKLKGIQALSDLTKEMGPALAKAKEAEFAQLLDKRRIVMDSIDLLDKEIQQLVSGMPLATQQRLRHYLSFAAGLLEPASPTEQNIASVCQLLSSQIKRLQRHDQMVNQTLNNMVSGANSSASKSSPPKEEKSKSGFSIRI